MNLYKFSTNILYKDMNERHSNKQYKSNKLKPYKDRQFNQHSTMYDHM